MCVSSGSVHIRIKVRTLCLIDRVYCGLYESIVASAFAG